MAALEEIGGAAEVAAVGAAEPGEYHAGPRRFLAEDAHAADDQRVPVGHRHLRLFKKPPHEAHTLLPADVIAVLPEDLVGQDRAVATQHDLRIRRVFPDESDDLLHAMEGR